MSLTSADKYRALTANLIAVHEWATMYRGRSATIVIDNCDDSTMTISLDCPQGEELINGLARDMPRLLERAAQWVADHTQAGRGYGRTEQ